MFIFKYFAILLELLERLELHALSPLRGSICPQFHVKGVFLSHFNTITYMFNVMCTVSFCVQGAANGAPEVQHPVEETTRDTSTGGSSRPLLVCMVVCV